MPFEYDYDAFLSYNRHDGELVERIAQKLVDAQLRPFLDKWHLVPGEPWQDEIERALDRSATCVVFVSSHGPSAWAHNEMRVALELRASKQVLRVIPTLLPGVTEAQRVSLPMFLKSLTWVDYTGGINDATAFDRLLAGIVGRSPFAQAQLVSTPAPARRYGTVIVESLVPAADFQERPELEEIRSFWVAERGGILALIGIGGAGKTALTCRFLQELGESGVRAEGIEVNPALPPTNGLFAWSFYDYPDVELFMHALYEYLTGTSADERPARTLTYEVIRLIEKASGRLLMVLDGMELIQENQESAAGFGLLRDSSMRHLMRRLSQGGLAVRALLTSRFPFPDLVAFTAAAYRTLDTDHLVPASARALLRRRGVGGPDAALDRLVHEFGAHALTLDHLGTILHDYFAGDSGCASLLPAIGTASGDAVAEYQAHRLQRIFTFYEVNLPDTERRVLQALCVLRVPMAVVRLEELFSGEHKDRVSPLPRLTKSILHAALGRLHSRRLITVHVSNGEKLCAVHPSIRDHFYRGLGSSKERVHGIVADQLVSLIERPRSGRESRDPYTLDLAEELMFHMVRSGDPERALDFYDTRIGGYRHLAWRMAEYERGLRITDTITESGGIALQSLLSVRPWYERSLFHLALGHTAIAETQMRQLMARLPDELVRDTKTALLRYPDSYSEGDLREWRTLESLSKERAMRISVRDFQLHFDAMLRQSLSDAIVVQGKFEEAERLASSVLADVSSFVGENRRSFGAPYLPANCGWSPFGRRARARALMGRVDEALEDFESAAKSLRGTHSVGKGYDAAFHGLLAVRLGYEELAGRILRRENSVKMRREAPQLAAMFDIAEAELLLLRGKAIVALPRADDAVAWAVESGHQETYATAQILRARICFRLQQHNDAHSAIADAENVAMRCQFHVLRAEALIIAGHLALAARDLGSADSSAIEAMSISESCSGPYLWGISGSSHLRAAIAKARGDASAAGVYALAAMRCRAVLRDPRLENSRAIADWASAANS